MNCSCAPVLIPRELVGEMVIDVRDGVRLLTAFTSLIEGVPLLPTDAPPPPPPQEVRVSARLISAHDKSLTTQLFSMAFFYYRVVE